ncbi:MAG: hypothetical protein ABII22_00455 [Candidatus Micrarchaeota archaeon]
MTNISFKNSKKLETYLNVNLKRKVGENKWQQKRRKLQKQKLRKKVRKDNFLSER